MPNVRIVAWNIAEGMNNTPRQQVVTLTAISGCLFTASPDIVLLNEVCIWNAWTNGGIDQIAWLAQHAGYSHVQWTKTATLALKGAKYVAVLSRIPLLSAERIEHSVYPDGGGYASLHVTANINDRLHHIFSVRFTAWDVAENLRSHAQLRDIITAIPNDEAVIIGGDFNTGAFADQHWPPSSARTPDYNAFASDTQLRHVLGGVGWTNDPGPVDHMLVRGAYVITRAERQDPATPNPSDHPWVLAELAPREVETVAPVTAIAPREDELLVSGIAKREQGGSLMSAQWAPATGWRGWTPSSIDYGRFQGFVSAAVEDDRSYLLWVGADGFVYHRPRTRDGQWQIPWPVGNSANPPLHGVPGGAVHGVSCQPGVLHVFYSNAQGRVIVARRDTAGGGTWPEHGGLSGGVTAPGGHVTAVSPVQGQIDAFCVGTDGGVYTSSWRVGGQWSGWKRIGDLVARPGNYIGAVSRSTNKIDVFVVDAQGRTMSAAWEPAPGWRGWWHIQGGRAAPTGLVTAVSRSTDMLDIFTRGTDGRVYTAAWSPTGGWGGWWSINDAHAIGPVWPVSRSRDKLDIFFTAPDGTIQTAAWPAAGRWGGPWVISERWA